MRWEFGGANSSARIFTPRTLPIWGNKQARHLKSSPEKLRRTSPNIHSVSAGKRTNEAAECREIRLLSFDDLVREEQSSGQQKEDSEKTNLGNLLSQSLDAFYTFASASIYSYTYLQVSFNVDLESADG